MRARLLLASAVALVVGLAAAPVATADPSDPPGSKASPTGRAHRAHQAEQALAEVEAILAGNGSQRSRADGHAHGRSLTVALRDLWVAKEALSPVDRTRAERILARPRASARSCSKNVCVHYTRSGSHAPSLRDRNRNRVPDYIDKVRTTVQSIHTKYRRAGYRSPLPDGRRGGDERTDIYIRNVGGSGLYGYCTSDDPRKRYDVWAFCTLDDDYAKAQFPTNTPLENLRVTAAHEYFHAVQYAYDAYEDGWILESTAAWIEDEVYDSVNDNRQYLQNSPMRYPHTPIDYFNVNKGYHYGVWIFWRYLTERYSSSAAGLPTLVRDVWRRLDGRSGAPDDYSTEGLSKVLSARGTTLPAQFARFADANRHPSRSYEEGSNYNSSPLEQTVQVTTAAPNPAAFSRQLDHLTSAAVRYVPAADMTAANWNLDLDFDLADTATGAAAVVTVYRQDGSIQTTLAPLDENGNTLQTFDFSVSTVKFVDVTLVNASVRMTNCWTRTQFACQGVAVDDNLVASVNPAAYLA